MSALPMKALLASLRLSDVAHEDQAGLCVHAAVSTQPTGDALTRRRGRDFAKEDEARLGARASGTVEAMNDARCWHVGRRGGGRVSAWFALVPLAAIAALGCGEPITNADARHRADEIARDVQAPLVLDVVKRIVAAHDADTPLPCEKLFALENIDQTRRPVCHLTHDKAREYVVSTFQTLGLDVHTQRSDGVDPRLPTSNVVADIPGEDSSAGVVIVGAHYDAFFHGADDNTSGVAAMIEMARVLRGHRYKRTIRFIAFDLEELGLVGSTRYVNGPGRDQPVAGAIVFDCIGYSDSTPGSQSSLPGLPVPDRGDFIALISDDRSAEQAAQIRDLAANLQIVPTETVIAPKDSAGPISGNLMRSDHAPFWLAGAPAVFLTDTANFRNPNYHKDTDTVDTLDPDFLGKVTRLSATTVAYWAEVQP